MSIHLSSKISFCNWWTPWGSTPGNRWLFSHLASLQFFCTIALRCFLWRVCMAMKLWKKKCIDEISLVLFTPLIYFRIENPSAWWELNWNSVCRISLRLGLLALWRGGIAIHFGGFLFSGMKRKQSCFSLKYLVASSVRFAEIVANVDLFDFSFNIFLNLMADNTQISLAYQATLFIATETEHLTSVV